eukprot:CAMPEP_0183319168 /NCGR_PEP_ID=MMETSP0160_2-20130417/62755_1 /TAXON_ID=2839 ORGANISM="Odontella Sinensis, Strain Grunow 1884" /NCGR_SAMPLE_ID=MMETSP0160_2 /ASSEMBLY_ACC=CAM_ASM_000250 /LENGTH=56 /DNA_ID=CAMNT_0025485595 /DNA_START=49 /DNA_END=215 /DNA_ORIENTATION=-
MTTELCEVTSDSNSSQLRRRYTKNLSHPPEQNFEITCCGPALFIETAGGSERDLSS